MPPVTEHLIRELFERHRAIPGAPLDESHFLDYLIPNPNSIGAVRNSFLGLRRYNAFVDEVQLQFNICFSVSDFESNYSLPQFVSRVAELQRSPRGSIASLRNQRKRGFGWETVLLGNFFAMVLLVWLWRSWPGAAYAIAG